MSTETTVLLLELSPWLARLLVEVVLLWRRRPAAVGPKPPTISMVLRDKRYYLTSHIYLLSGLLMHWFVPWRHASVVGSVAFWLIAVAVFVWDLVLRKKPVREWPTWMVVARDPPMWLLIGALAGFLLFPQGT